MSVQRRRIPSSVAFLQPFVDAGLFEPAEIHLVATMARLMPATPTDVLLALAVAARGPRLGHICVHLADVASTVVGSDDGTEPAALIALPWPEPGAWIAAVEADAAAAEGIVAHPGTVAAAPLRPLVFDGTRIYLQRYWTHERTVAESLSARARPHPPVDPAAVERVLDRYFPAGGPAGGSDGDTGAGALQCQAVRVALGSRLSVIAGGPGTGKTFTIARLLLAALDLHEDAGAEPLSVALAAPTGKAANRMTAAVTAALAEAVPTGEGGAHIPEATTIHRLLGWAPGTEFAHNAANPLDADLVVIDETSMVDLALMARLLDAVGPEARLVLVGDPYQLASVEAGTVLGDIVGAAADPTSPMAGVLTVLTRVHRFAEGSAIAEVAELVRRGHTDVLLERLRRGSTAVPTTTAPHPRPEAGPVQQRFDLDGTASDDDPDAAAPPVDTVDWVEPGDPDVLGRLTTRLATAGVDVIHAAREGDGRAAAQAAGAVKLLAATRRGPLGLYGWSDRIEKAIAELVPGLRRGERWYVGRPVLITANDPLTGVANGDVGVVVARAPEPAPGPIRASEGSPDPATDGDPRSIALELKGELEYLPPARLDHVDTWWAMTVHKSQGSEFPEVIVSLPAAGSPILTRELLYTAVTRAQERVTIVASEEAIRAAVDRPVTRASGLRERLGG